MGVEMMSDQGHFGENWCPDLHSASSNAPKVATYLPLTDKPKAQFLRGRYHGSESFQLKMEMHITTNQAKVMHS